MLTLFAAKVNKLPALPVPFCSRLTFTVLKMTRLEIVL